jgi:hypothetical protein
LDEQGPPAHLKPFLSRLDRNGRIGDLKPDLVIATPDQRMIIWDLTSREREEHLAKTLLYTLLLTPDNHLAHVGETYWLQPGTPPPPLKAEDRGVRPDRRSAARARTAQTARVRLEDDGHYRPQAALPGFVGDREVIDPRLAVIIKRTGFSPSA